jgi:hypothetical protein
MLSVAIVLMLWDGLLAGPQAQRWQYASLFL